MRWVAIIVLALSAQFEVPALFWTIDLAPDLIITAKKNLTGVGVFFKIQKTWWDIFCWKAPAVSIVPVSLAGCLNRFAGAKSGQFFAVYFLREGSLGNSRLPVAPERSAGFRPRCVVVSIVLGCELLPGIFPG